MKLLQALIGPKAKKMNIEELEDHLYDVEVSIASSKRRLTTLEQEMDRKLEQALQGQGSMYHVLIAEMIELEGDIEMEGLVVSLFSTEKSNVKEMIRIQNTKNTLHNTKFISSDQSISSLIKHIRAERGSITKEIEIIKKTRDMLMQGNLGGSIVADDPRAEKFATLIGKIQHARALGGDEDTDMAKITLRKAVKEMYDSRSVRE